MSIHWRPLRDIEEMTEELEAYWGSAWDLAADVYEEKDKVVIEMYLPGIKHEDIDVEVEEDYVHVSAEREQEHEKEEKQFFKREIRYGSFERIIDLPYSVDPDKAEAGFSDGILKIVLPKQAVKKSNKVAVQKK